MRRSDFPVVLRPFGVGRSPYKGRVNPISYLFRILGHVPESRG